MSKMGDSSTVACDNETTNFLAALEEFNKGKRIRPAGTLEWSQMTRTSGGYNIQLHRQAPTVEEMLGRWEVEKKKKNLYQYFYKYAILTEQFVQNKNIKVHYGRTSEFFSDPSEALKWLQRRHSLHCYIEVTNPDFKNSLEVIDEK